MCGKMGQQWSTLIWSGCRTSRTSPACAVSKRLSLSPSLWCVSTLVTLHPVAMRAYRSQKTRLRTRRPLICKPLDSHVAKRASLDKGYRTITTIHFRGSTVYKHHLKSLGHRSERSLQATFSSVARAQDDASTISFLVAFRSPCTLSQHLLRPGFGALPTNQAPHHISSQIFFTKHHKTAWPAGLQAMVSLRIRLLHIENSQRLMFSARGFTLKRTPTARAERCTADSSSSNCSQLGSSPGASL